MRSGKLCPRGGAGPGDPGRPGKVLRARGPLGVGIWPPGLGAGRGSSYLRGEAPGPGGGGGSGCGTPAPRRLLHHNIPRPGARGPRGCARSGGARGAGARGEGRHLGRRGRGRELLGAALAAASWRVPPTRPSGLAANYCTADWRCPQVMKTKGVEIKIYSFIPVVDLRRTFTGVKRNPLQASPCTGAFEYGCSSTSSTPVNRTTIYWFASARNLETTLSLDFR
uniref:Uncharacterized protein n=1 Tax=Myotis myotis TaxID=51298 RepID=A0A7J7VIM8_MYOMY|nr:hypothetical protein mMyoMyo1_008322 [Myotis myotis]